MSSVGPSTSAAAAPPTAATTGDAKSTEPTELFPKSDFACTEGLPFVVRPLKEINFVQWAQKNQKAVAEAIRKYGAIVFSGFGLKKGDFKEAFTAATGMPPRKYEGDTPRGEIGAHVYQSTAVGSGHHIPLHQEVSYTPRELMPEFISFFCVTPPKPGTGRTLVGNGRAISADICKEMPEFWKKMTAQKLTYIARYLPSDTLRTKWTQWWNPSHATIKARFGSEERAVIERKCKEEGVTCEWDGSWVVVKRKGIPATINVGRETLFCNSMHDSKLFPGLCGGNFNYVCARALLYQTAASMQFGVEWDNGEQIDNTTLNTLLTIIERHRVGRDWKAGDLMILDNVTTFHGKTVHEGPREIHVAMCGSVQ